MCHVASQFHHHVVIVVVCDNFTYFLFHRFLFLIETGSPLNGWNQLQIDPSTRAPDQRYQGSAVWVNSTSSVLLFGGKIALKVCMFYYEIFSMYLFIVYHFINRLGLWRDSA